MKLSYTDHGHKYWLDGTRCKGVSSVAKVPDDTYALEMWGKRMVALGMALDPALRERAIAHFDDKSELGDVAEAALTAAKAHEAAARGTAIHRTLERHDLGEELIDTPENRALRAAYDKALDSAGLVVVPEYVERIVVHPKLFIAGRFDRILKRKRDGKFVIGDVKSGTRAVQYPHAIAVQLALYANAPLLAGPVPRAGGKTEVFESLPAKLDHRWGYIIHAPGPDKVEVVKVDIAGGWDIAKRAIFPILEWRARKDLTEAVGEVAITDVDALASDERVAWVRARLAEIATHGDRGRALAAMRWPVGIAPQGPWSDADITTLDVMLRSVERDCEAGFPERDPALTINEHASA